MSSAGVALIDGSLVTRSQDGDQDAISELAAQVRPMVQRYAGRFFADPARAEDLAQTALMKAFARVGDVRSPGAFQAWVLRIARNECLNELARQKHAQLPLSTLSDGGAEIEAPAGGDDDPEEALLRSQLQALVRRVAATLPPHYRQALTMRALEDRTYEEISEALDIPVPVARLWYCRARKRFRSAFVTMMVARRNVPAACQEMGEAIAEMIEGTLPAGDRPRVQEHLGGCHVCRQTEDELRNTAFRAPARGFIIGLGLLRLGWRLPQRLRSGLSHTPHALGKLAISGVGGVAVATAMVAGSPILPATAHANGAPPSAHLRLMSFPQSMADRAVLAEETLRTLAPAAAPQTLVGLPDLGGGLDNLTLVIQRLDDISPNVLHLSALRLVPQAQGALARHADAARAAAAGTVDDLEAQQQRAQEQARERAQQQREQQQKAQQAQKPSWPQPDGKAATPSGNAAPNGTPPNGQPAPKGNPAPSGGSAPGAPASSGAPAPAGGTPSQQPQGGNQQQPTLK